MNLPFLDLFVTPLLLALAYMSGVFLLAFLKKDNSIVDVGWGIGFIVLAWYAYMAHPQTNERQLLVNTLVTIWGLRLSLHIGIRNLGRGEDFRYKAWRKQWGKYALIRSFFQVFMLQGFMLALVIQPVMFVHVFEGQPIRWLDLLGVTIWSVGFIFEAIGDAQLLLFKRKRSNKGKIMKQGLWKYTRHPNYFGEATQWWGIFLIALSVPQGIYSIIGPILITFLLLRVSGVTLLETKYKGNKEYRDYQKTTSAFIPLPPRRR